jgi:hypothetical protein
MTAPDEHLTHGWEAGLAADDSILRGFLLSAVERGEVIARAVGGRYQRWDDVAVTDPVSPVIFDNTAVLLQPPAYVDLASTIARVLDFFPPERHFALLSAWPTPDLAEHGLELMGHPPFMLRPAGGAEPPPPEGLEIRRVTDVQTPSMRTRCPMHGALPSLTRRCWTARSRCSSDTSMGGQSRRQVLTSVAVSTTSSGCRRCPSVAVEASAPR